MQILDHIFDGQNTMGHHTANVTAVAVPAVSWSLHGPEVITYITAGLGAVWYLILIGKEVASWFRKRRDVGPPRSD